MSRSQKRRTNADGTKRGEASSAIEQAVHTAGATDDAKLMKCMNKNKDKMISFVAELNRLYQEVLKRPAPFMTYILIGLQSSGKSTFIERLLNIICNIVREGTGTKCPLNITTIHDDKADEPVCKLRGKELKEGAGENLNASQVFASITTHNVLLEEFSTEPLYLEVRYKNVHNMMFVDLPGIIMNTSTGKDNREEIKKILEAEIFKPNTKMAVVLEPTEFAKNGIIDFIDKTLGGREKWVDKALFIMNKWDKQMQDSRTASKANSFLGEYRENRIWPYFMITPTLDNESLDGAALYEKRKENLARSEKYERDMFGQWLSSMEEHKDGQELFPQHKKAISFPVIAHDMNQQLLEDTFRRLPTVLEELRKQLKDKEREKRQLTEQLKFSDPVHLSLTVTNILHALVEKINSYLDGSVEVAVKFPDCQQDLFDELDLEEESEWVKRELNHHTESEELWREHIAEMKLPEEIQEKADYKLFGGKQFQRAIHFFNAVMIDKLPDPSKLRPYVVSGTGYLGGDLQRENWERATVQIVRSCMKEITAPGINFLIKHVGSIFRRLFTIALQDARQGEMLSLTFQLLPDGIEKFLQKSFDEMVWAVCLDASKQTHSSLEPMYSTVNANLPTLVRRDYLQRAYEDETKGWNHSHGDFSPSSGLLKKLTSIFSSGAEAKKGMQAEAEQRMKQKKGFLPNKRSAMITHDETGDIIAKSFEYIAALTEYNLVNLQFQFDHYLYKEFKNRLKLDFGQKLVQNTKFDELVDKDVEIEERVKELDEQIEGIRASLARASAYKNI